MPLYEYHCNDCGEQFEKMVRFSEVNTNPECPHCTSADTRKKLSTIAALNTTSSGSSSSSGGGCGSGGGFS